MQTPTRIEIHYAGKRWRFDLAAVARLLRIGLTPAGYEMLALVADAYHTNVAELMERALESEVQS